MLVAGGAYSVELVTNGNFTSNGGIGTSSFTGWTTYSNNAGNGQFVADTLSNPPSGVAAFAAQGGLSTQVIYQSVTIPAGVTNATFSASISINNFGLGYNPSITQFARADVMSSGSDPTVVNGTGVLLNLFLTTTGSPNVVNYLPAVTADLTAFAGQTVIIRFATTATIAVLEMGIANVSLNATSAPAPTAQAVPSLSEWSQMLLGLLVMTLLGWHFHKQRSY